MTRGESTHTKVHFKGQKTDDEFAIFVEDLETMEKWKKDKSVPLAQVVQSFTIFTTHNQGASAPLEKASSQMLETEFGTKVIEDVIKVMLEKGEVHMTEGSGRGGTKSDSRGVNTGR